MPSRDLVNGEINEEKYASFCQHLSQHYVQVVARQSEQSKEIGWLSGFIRFVCNAMLA